MGTLATAALWVVVWQVASVIVGNQILLASPWETLARLVVLVGDPTFWATVAQSFCRIALGFSLGFVAAAVLGTVAARHGWAARLVGPLLSFLKSVPLVCIIVLLLIWVGSRRVSAIAVFLVVFPAVYFSVVEGLREADPAVGQMLKVFGVGGVRSFLAHGWPSLVPFLEATCRNVCGMAWKAGVAAEVIGSPKGTIGWNVYQAKLLLETADLFAWTLVVVFVSWACEKAFLALLGTSSRWAMRLSLARPASGRAGTSCEAEGAMLKDISIGHGESPVAEGLTVELRAGERVVLTDPSGAGKTTLLQTLEGLLPPLGGGANLPRRISAVFQESRLIEGMSAEENVLLVAGGTLESDGARSLLAELLPQEALGRPVAELSGGQRRRVELVRAMARPSGIVLLDEPFASLDEESHRLAADFVVRHLAGRTLLVASHLPGDAALLGAREARIGTEGTSVPLAMRD